MTPGERAVMKTAMKQKGKVVRYMRIRQDNGVFDSNEASEGGLFGMRFVIVNGKEPEYMWKTVSTRMPRRP